MSIIYNTIERLEKEGAAHTENLHLMNGEVSAKKPGRVFGKGVALLGALVVVGTAIAVWRTDYFTGSDLASFSAVAGIATKSQPEETVIPAPVSQDAVYQETVAGGLEKPEKTLSADTLKTSPQQEAVVDTLTLAQEQQPRIKVPESPAEEKAIPDVREVAVAKTVAVTAEVEDASLSEIIETQPVSEDRAKKIIDQIVEASREALAKGQYLQALSILEGVSAKPEHRADFWFVKGSVHLGLGQLNHAEKSFEVAQGLLPDQPQIAIQLAIISQEKGDHTRALGILRKTADSFPNVPEVYLNLGYSQHAMGATREAAQSFRVFLTMTEGRSVYADERRAINNWLAQAKPLNG